MEKKKKKRAQLKYVPDMGDHPEWVCLLFSFPFFHVDNEENTNNLLFHQQQPQQQRKKLLPLRTKLPVQSGTTQIGFGIAIYVCECSFYGTVTTEQFFKRLRFRALCLADARNRPQDE
jgi:hypothetical protein